MWICRLYYSESNPDMSLACRIKNCLFFIRKMFLLLMNFIIFYLLDPVCTNAYAATKMLSPDRVRPLRLLRPSILLTSVYHKCLCFDFDNVVVTGSMILFVDALKFHHMNAPPI